MKKDISLLVLAAGMGSRYGGLKQLDALGPNGETILEYSIYDAVKAGFTKVVFVIRDHFEQDFRDKIGDRFAGDIEVVYVHQKVNPEIAGVPNPPVREKPWGTSQAVLVAKDVIDEPFAVINADDYYGQQCFQVMGNFLREEVTPETFSMVGYTLVNTLSEKGHVNRGVCSTDEEGNLAAIREILKIHFEGDKIVFGDGGDQTLAKDAIVSMNFWGFHQSIFKELETGFKRFVEANLDNPKAEYYIPIIIDELIKSDKIKVKMLHSEDQWYGVTYKEDAVQVKQAFHRFAQEGRYPTPLWK
ncbi:MAG: NTP transferase domain-containing protein [Saprospiraceae bacterium]|nr:NTP transferase domain-containing protein [Saprospiraceae bacterium]